MNKCIAIPLEDGILCAHFGHCQEFAIVTVVNGEIDNIKKVIPPEHVPGLYPRWVAQFGVTDVVAGGMGQQAINLFNEQQINAFVGAPMLTPEEIVNEFISGNLNLSSNYCNHDDNSHDGCNH